MYLFELPQIIIIFNQVEYKYSLKGFMNSKLFQLQASFFSFLFKSLQWFILTY